MAPPPCFPSGPIKLDKSSVTHNHPDSLRSLVHRCTRGLVLCGALSWFSLQGRQGQGECSSLRQILFINMLNILNHSWKVKYDTEQGPRVFTFILGWLGNVWTQLASVFGLHWKRFQAWWSAAGHASISISISWSWGSDQREVGDALRTASCFFFLWSRFRCFDCFCFHCKTLLTSKTQRRTTWAPFYFTWLNPESVADGVNPQTKRSKFPPHVKVSNCQRHLERSLLTPADIFPICPGDAG